MSSSRRALLVMLSSAMLLTGCGFHPLHGKSSANKSTADELSRIKIQIIADRSGQMVRNELLDLLTPMGEPAKPRYTLRVTLNESKQSLGILKDETASRSNFVLTASFALMTLPDGKTLYGSAVTSQASYNILEQHYASTSAEKNARERTAKEVAQGIELQLSSYFSRVQSAQQAPK